MKTSGNRFVQMACASVLLLAIGVVPDAWSSSVCKTEGFLGFKFDHYFSGHGFLMERRLKNGILIYRANTRGIIPGYDLIRVSVTPGNRKVFHVKAVSFIEPGEIAAKIKDESDKLKLAFPTLQRKTDPQMAAVPAAKPSIPTKSASKSDANLKTKPAANQAVNQAGKPTNAKADRQQSNQVAQNNQIEFDSKELNIRIEAGVDKFRGKTIPMLAYSCQSKTVMQKAGLK